MTVRLGVVGAGSRFRTLLEAIYRVRDGTALPSAGPPGGVDPLEPARPVVDLEPAVTALFDPDPEQRERTRAICLEHGDDPDEFERFQRFRAAGTYDAVVVASPNDTHVEPTTALLADGIDLLVEKPLATTLPAHDRIIEAAADAESTLYPGFNLRSSPFFARLRGLVEGGAVGDVGMVSCQEARGPFVDVDWLYSREHSGGTFLTKNCHDFDLFNWFVGADPVRVSAAGRQHVLDADTDVLDSGSVVVEYDDGSVATLELCLYAPWGVRTRKYELRGEEGLLRSPEAAGTVEHHTEAGCDRLEVATAGTHGGADAVQAARFLRCCRGAADPPATPTDAKRAAAVGIAARRAAESAESVRITGEYDLAE